MFDSASRHTTHGVSARFARPAWRRLVFAAGPFELDLRLVRSAHAHADQVVYAMSGQVLGPCTGRGSVSLCGSDALGPRLAAVTLNSICEFEFRAVRPGRYALALDLPGDSIHVSDLHIGD